MICVAANPSADATFSVERLEPGSIHRPIEHVRVAGGKALNVARAAVALGGEVLAVALAPEHGAAWLHDELEREGVPLETLTVPGVLRGCLSVFAAEDATLTEFYDEGAAIDEADWGAFARLVSERARGDEWMAICGSLPPGAPTDAYARLIDGAAGAPAALDASGPELETGAAAGPELIKVNEAEALATLGREPVTMSGPEGAALARLLRDRAGPRARAIVTLGDRGAVIAGPDGVAAARLDEPPSPYAVGSGDAFLAGILTARERGDGWDEALRLAMACGAANAERPGPGRLDRARAERLADRVAIEPLPD